MSKRVFIKTYGCQMNVYDSSRMATLLSPLGYRKAAAPEGADLVILNTCHIREKAAEKVFSELGELRQLKERKAKAGGRMLIAVGGCVAQAEGALLRDRAPFVDIVFGPQSYHRLPEFLARVEGAAGERVVDTSFPPEAKFGSLPDAGSAAAASALLSIQEGCDKFCTFCVVPYTRGAEFSRPAAQILAEARGLVDSGAREVTLLGQNVNAYRGAGPEGGNWGLGDLLRALSEIPGLQRLRYTTSHPRDVDESLLAAHRDLPKLMPHLHLPVQSGADRVLALMNRQHTAEEYRRLVARLRTARPDLALSSDFIVGFPGESEEDFAATLALVREVGFAQAFSFKYSPRPGTPAAAARQVPEEEKAQRLRALQELLFEQQRRFNEGFLGRVLPVLLEKPGRRPGQLLGKSPYLQSVHVMAGKERIGAIVPVLIGEAGTTSLGGTLMEAAHA